MTVTFDEPTRMLLDGRNFATVATLNPDGGLQTSVVWITRDGDTVLFSSTAGRRKIRNLVADPRVSLTVIDIADPYHSVEIRGTAELIADDAKVLPKRLSHKYLGEDPPAEPDEVTRMIVCSPHTRSTASEADVQRARLRTVLAGRGRAPHSRSRRTV